jgi:hypothetical protein
VPPPLLSKGPGDGAFLVPATPIFEETFAQLSPFPVVTSRQRGLKVRTRQGMVALTADEAAALLARLEREESGRAAAGTFAVSANASTSITFTDGEKLAVLDALQDLASVEGAPSSGLQTLRVALARDLDGR